jgi:hypothetical protein
MFDVPLDISDITFILMFTIVVLIGTTIGFLFFYKKSGRRSSEPRISEVQKADPSIGADLSTLNIRLNLSKDTPSAPTSPVVAGLQKAGTASSVKPEPTPILDPLFQNVGPNPGTVPSFHPEDRLPGSEGVRLPRLPAEEGFPKIQEILAFSIIVTIVWGFIVEALTPMQFFVSVLVIAGLTFYTIRAYRHERRKKRQRPPAPPVEKLNSPPVVSPAVSAGPVSQDSEFDVPRPNRAQSEISQTLSGTIDVPGSAVPSGSSSLDPRFTSEEFAQLSRIQEFLGLSTAKIELPVEAIENIFSCAKTLKQAPAPVFSGGFQLPAGEKIFYLYKTNILASLPLPGKKVHFPMEDPMTAFRGLTIRSPEKKVLNPGNLGVTSRRLLVQVGPDQIDISFESIFSVELFADAVKIHSAGQKPELCLHLENPPLLLLSIQRMYENT